MAASPSASSGSRAIPSLALSWPTDQLTGWGSVGRGLTDALARKGWTIHPEATPDYHLSSLGNVGLPAPVTTARTLGYVVAETSTFDAQSLDALRTYDLLLTGCQWTTDVLARHGLRSHPWPQGVETDRFVPQPRLRAPGEPFRIFSGGKFEYRKGHDLVIETFRRFHARHPDAQLVTLWHNYWPSTVGPLHKTGWLTTLPAYDKANQTWGYTEWLMAQGLTKETFVCVGPTDSHELPALLASCHAALFLSRAEGNTNLAMMEAVVSGLPTVSSRNTGLLDVALTENPVRWCPQQRPVLVQGHAAIGQEGWGESSVAEACAHLEAIYDGWHAHPDPLPSFRTYWSWEARADALIALLCDSDCSLLRQHGVETHESGHFQASGDISSVPNVIVDT